MKSIKTSTSNIELSILIPVFNEEKTIKQILYKTSKLPIKVYELIIVDDASTDNSSKIIEKFIKNHKTKNVKIISIRHDMNKGKGAGIQSALKIATGEYFVIQDADLEYDPAEIPNLLKFAKQNDYDAVYGSRFLGNIHRMPRANYIANRAYNIILRILYNTNITDMHTCYKMVRTSLLKKLGIVSNGFGYATELVSKLLKSGVIIYEIPISFNGRTKQEGKKIDIMDGLECAYKLISYRYGKNDTPFTVKRTTVTRFILVGGLGFLTNYALLVLLTELTNLGYILAEIIAALIALHVTFVFHDQWTYRLYTPPGTAMFGFKTRYVTYVFSNALGSLFTVVSFSVLFNYLDRLLSLVIAAIIGVCWNYAANTFIIWRKKN